VSKRLGEIDMDHRERQAMTRSQRIRKMCEWLPETAVKNRKAFYTNNKDGYLNKEPGTANQPNLMGNPDMMNNMLK
jgi:hypothetical protein